MKFNRFVKRLFDIILSPLRKKVSVQALVLSPNELLKGKKALVTGGTSGIGFAIAKAFINSGASVVITGRKMERIQDACERLINETSTDAKIFGLQLDNTHIEEFEEKVQEAVYLLDGSIDILVNNAGVVGGRIMTTTEMEYDTILDTNLKGAFFLSKVVSSYMVSNKINGNILNIASSSSLRPAVSAYTLSKWGIRGLTLGLAKMLIPYGIVVNGLAPGPTATPMLKKNNDGDFSNFGNPTGRFATAEEIGNMAVVLTSGLGRMIVGDIIYMTGGAGLITYEDYSYKFEQ
jgi:3-oxoacyl-[acyl-carrier protein] reductase